jgi:O-glycosyl hydrolase
MGTDGNAVSSNTWPDAQKAAARGVTTFIGSAYCAPASFKDNNSVNDGGHLKPSSRDAWANTIAAFPAKVKTNVGVDLYAMSLQSAVDFASCGTAEPCNGNYDSMVFTANEYVAFLKVAGPKLHNLSPPVKVIGPEASEWNHLWSNKSATGSEPSNGNSSDPLGCGFPDGTDCTTGNGYDYGHALYADSTAWSLLDLMGVQQYDSQVADPWPGDVPVEKPVWQTEMSGIKWWPEQGPSTTIDNGLAVAGWIHDAVVNGEAAAWLWYTYQANTTDDNEGLLLKDGTDTKRHYTLGNFSKFVRPGDYRVDVTGPIPSGVLLSAFKGVDGHVVIVAINTTSSAQSVPITITGGTAPTSMQPWITSSVDNLAGATALSLSSGQFTAPLGPKSVTTFYGTAP